MKKFNILQVNSNHGWTIVAVVEAKEKIGAKRIYSEKHGIDMGRLLAKEVK